MGFLRNSGSNTSIPTPAGAINDTPTHASIWDGNNMNSANWIADIALLDDVTGNTPVFDLALGDTLQFDASDFAISLAPGTGQGEALAQDLLSGVPTYYLFFHTGAPGNNHMANVITEITAVPLNNLVYAAS